MQQTKQIDVLLHALGLENETKKIVKEKIECEKHNGTETKRCQKKTLQKESYCFFCFQTIIRTGGKIFYIK